MRLTTNLGKSVVGLDIQPGCVTAVECENGQPAVARAAIATLPPEVVRDGVVADAPTLADVLRELFAQHKLNRRVRLGVANQQIVMRTLDLPPLSGAKDIASAVRFQAQDHIPMPLDQAVVQHQTLGNVETVEGERTRVVVVAARRDMIEVLLSAVRGAGLRTQGIDFSAFAMIRALHPRGSSDATLYVNVSGVTTLAVAVGSTCVFTRVAAHGTESMALELAERRGLTLEHAHSWMRHVGLASPLGLIDGDPEIVEAAREVLQTGAARTADEVRTSLDFHSAQESAETVERAILTGPAVEIPGFCEHLSAQASLTVEPGVLSEAHPGAFGGASGARLAVAAGLTLDEVAA